LDAIGKSSSNGLYGNDEREQTLNQLLTDGRFCCGDATVIVLAATNRPESLIQRYYVLGVLIDKCQ